VETFPGREFDLPSLGGAGVGTKILKRRDAKIAEKIIKNHFLSSLRTLRLCVRNIFRNHEVQ